MVLLRRDDPTIQKRITEIQNLLARKDYNRKQRSEVIREISRLADYLLSVTPKFDGSNSDYRHLPTVKVLDSWYHAEFKLHI